MGLLHQSHPLHLQFPKLGDQLLPFGYLGVEQLG